MLNSCCGHALSQGVGVTPTQDGTGKQLPLFTEPAESLEMIGSMPWGHTCPDLLWQPSTGGRIWECWQVQLIVGGVGNGAAEED